MGTGSVLNSSASGQGYGEYYVPVSEEGTYVPLLNSDESRYGGRGWLIPEARSFPADGGYKLKTTLPALSAVIYALK